nr:Chain A, TIA-1 prion-like domain [Homo sapiens]
GYRVAGYETQ